MSPPSFPRQLSAQLEARPGTGSLPPGAAGGLWAEGALPVLEHSGIFAGWESGPRQMPALQAAAPFEAAAASTRLLLPSAPGS